MSNDEQHIYLYSGFTLGSRALLIMLDNIL